MVRRARRYAGLPPGVRIRWLLDSTIAAQGWDGLCDDHDSSNRFTISIASYVTRDHAVWLIEHELAHVRQRIFHPEEVEDHGPGFGLELAYLHRRLVGEE